MLPSMLLILVHKEYYSFRDTMRRIEELVKFGGFTDTEYLRRSLAREFEQLCERYMTKAYYDAQHLFMHSDNELGIF